MSQSGGAFLPGDAATITGAWTFSTAPTLSTPTLTSPTISSATLSGDQTGSGTLTLTNTLTAAAYAASAHQDEMYSKITLTPATTVTAANGLNAFRGEVNITAGKTLGDGSGSYVTGVYGRVNFNTATVNIGSGDLAAVYAKFDMGSTSTLTSGHIAPLQSNIVNPPSGAGTTTDLIYAESASGTKIKSILAGYAAANYAMDLTDVGTSQFLPAISSTTLNGLNIKVLLNGTAYYIKTGTAA